MNEIINRLKSIDIDDKSAPTVHQIENPPRCEDCKIFDFSCAKCEALVGDDKTSIAQLMAIARQWSHSVQSKMNVLIYEMLRRGAHADDRDALTDM